MEHRPCASINLLGLEHSSTVRSDQVPSLPCDRYLSWHFEEHANVYINMMTNHSGLRVRIKRDVFDELVNSNCAACSKALRKAQ